MLGRQAVALDGADCFDERFTRLECCSWGFAMPTEEDFWASVPIPEEAESHDRVHD